MSEPRFIHLHVHSEYSIIDGLSKIDILVNKAVELNMPALAITDFSNLFGLIKFYKLAHSVGIKPIIGSDFFVQSEKLNKELTELTILASNNIGYKHLILLISNAYKRGYNATTGPVIDRDWLAEYNEGLILLSGASRGDVGKFLMRGNTVQVTKCITFYKHFFPDRYYLELVRTGRTDEERYIHAAVKLAEHLDMPIVATNDVRFISPDDFEAHEIRVAIQKGFTLHDIKRPRNYSFQQYMRSEEEMCELFADLPEALINSVEIARRCNVIIGSGKYFLPQFPTTNRISAENYLIKCAREGLEKRLVFLFPDSDIRNKNRMIYDKRLNTELQVINKMGFPSYFLIIMEFIQWSKDNSIPVGPGRGSGASSLVAYALNITDINPLEFDLLFERFLNPERVSMPDFDVDFCMEKRDIVIDHVSETYGRDAVSQIITFGTMSAKAVIRDVGRVFGYPYNFVNRISKLVPSDPGITLEKALMLEPQLKNIYDSDEEVKILIDMARRLEGITRNAGKHAGGLVIAPTKITDFIPIYCDHEGNNQVTQFDKNDVEYIGLVKFDFLGLRTLTIINWTLRMINEQRVCRNLEPIDISTIPLNDKKSFDILQKSETTAVFQLESRGMKDLIKRLKPDCFEDMIALVALFRPGPLQSGMVDNFINRKHGRELISYPDIKWQHSLLKSVLESTYGIILYQEQVMQIAQVMAGYTLGDADILRRAMGKKKPEEMAKQRMVFKTGAKRIGIDDELSMKIFDLVEKFASYGFNKSHSAAYALISYQTLWLKTHYPAEFMSAVMTADMDNTEKLVVLVDECLRMGLKILPPNINNGQYHFYVNQKGEIVYGIGAIKGIGKSHINAIIKARNKYGRFREMLDLCMRIDIKKINRRVLETMIMSGALDCLGSHRAELMNNLEDNIKIANQCIKTTIAGQSDMFGIKEQKILKTASNITTPWPEQVVLDGERATLGFYLTGHPITKYLKEIQYYNNGIRLKDMSSIEHGKIVIAAGLIVSSKITIGKHGNRIGVCTIDDRSGYLDVILFEDIFEKYQSLLEKDRILFVKGKISLNKFNNHFKIIAHELMDISDMREKYAHRLVISLTKKEINYQFLNRLLLLLEKHRSGNMPVYFYYHTQNTCAQFYCGKNWLVKPTDHLLNDLKSIVGNENVELLFD